MLKLFKNNTTCMKCKMLNMILDGYSEDELVDYEVVDTDTDLGMLEAKNAGVMSLPSLLIDGVVTPIQPTQDDVTKHLVK